VVEVLISASLRTIGTCADYLKGEVRFASVMKQFPAEAADLFKAAEDNAKWRYKSYLRMLSTQW
jgi:pyruvate-ferredoxin/flavodoxin oxidoreductase